MALEKQTFQSAAACDGGIWTRDDVHPLRYLRRWVLMLSPAAAAAADAGVGSRRLRIGRWETADEPDCFASICQPPHPERIKPPVCMPTTDRPLPPPPRETSASGPNSVHRHRAFSSSSSSSPPPSFASDGVWFNLQRRAMSSEARYRPAVSACSSLGAPRFGQVR